MKANKNILKSNSLSRSIVDIPIDQIQEPAWAHIMRETAVAPLSIDEMIRSIARTGLMQPIGITPMENGKYEIIYREREYLACQYLDYKAGLKSVKAVVASDAGEASLTFLIENTKRGSLLPIEEARMYQKVLDTKKISQSELAEKIGVTQDYVTRRLRLLELPVSIAFLMYSGKLTDEVLEQLYRVENIIEDIVTTDYTKSENYKTQRHRFKNWAQREQDEFAGYYVWDSEESIEQLKDAVDVFYRNLLIASSPKYNEELERKLLLQEAIIKKKPYEKWTAKEKRILRERWLCECKRKYNPILKIEEDKRFFSEQIKED